MKRLLILQLLLVTALCFAESQGTGLQISAAGDIVGSFGEGAQNRLDPREAEFSFYAPIDHLFDGIMTAAAHNENGDFKFEIHELYIGSTKLIPRSHFKIGKYFLGFGRLNQFHRHDWPFTSMPIVYAQFFDPINQEGVNDTGLEYGYLLPTSFYLDLTVGVANGWIFGGDGLGNKPYIPTHYARLATYHGLWGGGAQYGLNYVGRKDENGTENMFFGLDATAKWKEGPVLKWLFQNEFWYRVTQPADGQSTKAYGFYLYPQWGIDERWAFGVRLDGFHAALSDGAGAAVNNFDFAVVPTLTYKASEFSTLRASYDYNDAFYSVGSASRDKVFRIQAMFILGSHPAHDF